MKTAYFIRHGMTAGNKQGRYIGRTDEPLCEEGAAQAETLRNAGLPAFDRVFASPYRRCRETASILFPEMGFTVIPELRECDFGIFEGREAGELTNNATYAAWLASGCTVPIPGGESMDGFQARCHTAFLQAMEEVPENGCAAFVIHGGCIMVLLAACALPKRAFYEYHIGNCGLVRCAFDGGALMIEGDGVCS